METEDIVGRWINHKTHGKGKILEFDGKKIFVKFLNGDEFYFKYPDFNYERYFTFCTEVYNLDEDFDDGDEDDEDEHTTFRRSKYWKDLYRLSLGELIDDEEDLDSIFYEVDDEIIDDEFELKGKILDCICEKKESPETPEQPKGPEKIRFQDEFAKWLDEQGMHAYAVDTYILGVKWYIRFLRQKKC